jgi:16S rRNA C1402 (ribose-2'-O) methylase RsmI
MFEDIQIGTADELLALLSEHPEKNKGEFVVLVAPL